MRDEKELIQYIIVNKDLNMSVGKIVAQTNHVTAILTLRDGNTEKYQQWLNNSKRVIVLKAKKMKWKSYMNNVLIALK